MKKTILATALLFALVSCGKKEVKTDENLYPEKEISAEEQQIIDGKALFMSNRAACASCHMLDKKAVGPSIIEIMKVYKEKDGDVFAFLREKAEPIVDPAQYGVMKTNFAVLKTFTDDEVRSLEAYMKSELK